MERRDEEWRDSCVGRRSEKEARGETGYREALITKGGKVM